MGVAMALGVFFVLFLSASRLSFLGMPGAFWPQVFGLEPRLAFALGLLAIWVRLLGQARSVKSFLVAGITWGLLAWLDPRIAAYAALSAVVWVGVAWKLSRATWKMFLPLAVGLFLFLPWTGGFEPVHVSSETGTWYFAFDRLLSLTLDKGLVFYLALFSIMRMVRGKRLPELHFAVVVITGFGLWIASCLSVSVSLLVDPRLLGLSLNLLVAMAAGQVIYGLLMWLEGKAREIPDSVPRLPRSLEKLSLTVVGTAALVGASLPWCFPFWWHPVLMDSVYRESLEPIAPQFRPLSAWILAETEPDAVFVAGPSYSPWIPALTGRRVLLVEGTGELPQDVVARRRAESWFAESGDPNKIRQAAAQWDLTHLAWGRLDADGPLDVRYTFFERRPEFSLEWHQGRWIRVYAFRP